MAWSLPRALQALGADLVHTQYAAPLRCPCPCVVTVHDVSFARDPDFMSRKDRTVFRRVVPRAVRKAARVLTVSERTKADIVELYGVPAQRIVVTPNGVDPVFAPGRGRTTTSSSVGAIQRRKNQLAALEAARGRRASARRRRAGEGPGARGGAAPPRRQARGLRRRRSGSPSSIAARRVSSSRVGTRGSGSPSSRRWRLARRSSPCRIRRLREVAGDAAIFVEEAELADGIRRALAERERLVAAGLERARAFSWRAAAERTLAVYREILGT